MRADGSKPGRARRPGAVATAVLWLIRGYQLIFSPFYAGSCRFTPSCSTYAAEAVRRFGAVRGTWLACRRMLRCHPFGSHGFDPVPDRAPAVRRDSSSAVPRLNS